MRAARPWRAENWADFLPSTLGYSRPPVDLYAVARHRRIKQLGLRFMIPRGVLLPVEGGFEVYLRDPVRKDIDILEAEPVSLLSPRQRFALAHEIAHTFFYKFSDTVPAPDGTVSNALELEEICDRTAGHILVPTALLKRDIKRELGDCEKIDAAFVRSAASRFRTSLEVLIGRLSVVEPSNPFERCVLLVRRIHGDAEIRASYFGVGLLPILPRPVKYTRVIDWLADFPRRVIDGREGSDWTITRMGRQITFRKTDLGTSGDFLLQVQVATTLRTLAGVPQLEPSRVTPLD
jgi:hypothetical protein